MRAVDASGAEADSNGTMDGGAAWLGERGGGGVTHRAALAERWRVAHEEGFPLGTGRVAAEALAGAVAPVPALGVRRGVAARTHSSRHADQTGLRKGA
eukprot:3941713-Rhodomonas_salina.5